MEITSTRRRRHVANPVRLYWGLLLVGFVVACDGEVGQTPEGARSSDAAPLDENLRPSPQDGMPVCDLRLTQVAIYQAVKVPLLEAGDGAVLQPVANHKVDVITGRAAVIRVFAQAGGDLLNHPVTVRLRLQGPDHHLERHETLMMVGTSSDGVFDSTFNFYVSSEQIQNQIRLDVDVVAPATCASASVPGAIVAGGLTLSTRTTGTLQIRLVPIHYDADESGRLPDVSQPQLDRYRSLLAAMYPVANVDLQVREAVRTAGAITQSGGWEDLLDALRDLRARDGVAGAVHYYGLVNPSASFRSYCGRACTAGISYVTQTPLADFRVGLGLGYTGDFAAVTLAHELGHQHGRLHAPCNTNGEKGFPYAGGFIGSWGFDLRDYTLYSPTAFTDVMGYCEPVWVSDYSYQGFVEHLAALATSPLRLALTLAQSWRVLLVDEGAGRLRWGHPMKNSTAPAGTPERAWVLDENGALVTEVTVYRVPVADTTSSTYLVPAPEDHRWHFIELEGLPPHPFDADLGEGAVRLH